MQVRNIRDKYAHVQKQRAQAIATLYIDTKTSAAAPVMQ